MKYRFRLVEDTSNKEAILKAIGAVTQNTDKAQWLGKVGECVEKMDDKEVDSLVNTLKTQYGDTKIAPNEAENVMKQVGGGAAKAMVGDGKNTEQVNSLGQLFDVLDISNQAKQDPEGTKQKLVTILSCIPPYGPIIATVLNMVPADTLRDIFGMTAGLDPMHWAKEEIDKVRK